MITTETTQTSATIVGHKETMVDWLEGENFGVKDIDIEELRENIQETFRKCEHEEDRDLGIYIEEAYIVGSVARNDASKGMSDVDIVLQFASEDVGNMDPRYNLATTHVAKCMEDNWESIATPNMMKWITSIDIISAKGDNMADLVWRFGQDTRTGERFDSGYIYDIMENEYRR